MKNKSLLFIPILFIIFLIAATQVDFEPEFRLVQTQVSSLETRVAILEHQPESTVLYITQTPPPSPTIEVVCLIQAEVTASKLNVRKTPNGTFVRQIPRGQKITYVYENEYQVVAGVEWVRIDYGEWVAKPYLKDLTTCK